MRHTTTQVKGTLAQDYVTVVGASYMSLYEKVRGQKGNKMRFINQGIRQLTKYPIGTPNFTIQRVFLIFKNDYPENLLAALKDVVENQHGAQYREMDSISGLVDFIAARQRRGREIKQLDFFPMVWWAVSSWATSWIKTIATVCVMHKRVCSSPKRLPMVRKFTPTLVAQVWVSMPTSRSMKQKILITSAA